MTIGFVLAIVFTIGWLPPFLWRTEPLAQAFPAYAKGERFSTLATAIGLSVHMVAGCVLLTATDVPPLRATLAVAVFSFAIGFWYWGRRLIGPLRVRRMPDEPPPAFQRNGAFGVVRHPLYFSYLTAALAPVIATLNPWLIVSYGVCVALLGMRAVTEEKRLRAQLGAQYDAYSVQVKRLIPYVW
jgi:protein-S-isoprenylcysteine O-methyltransferase Ste14